LDNSHLRGLPHSYNKNSNLELLMRHPLEAAIPPEQRRNVLLAFLALSGILFGVVYAVGAGLKTDKAIQGAK
jgi:hypothetical protein